MDFNATTHGVRDLADDRLSNLIEAISDKRLGLADVEPDIIGRSKNISSANLLKAVSPVLANFIRQRKLVSSWRVL